MNLESELRVAQRSAELLSCHHLKAAQLIKKLPADAGGARDSGLIPVSGRCPGGGNGNPLQYFCLENSTDGGAWWATVHGVAKSRTRLNRHALTLRQKGQPRVNRKGREPQRDACAQ